MRKHFKNAGGFALPMVLVILVLGGVLVSVTYNIVNNLVASSTNVVEKVELYNAAVDGLEKGKIWIRGTMSADGQLPRWEADNPFGELNRDNLSGGNYDVLKVRDIDGNLPNINYSIGQVAVTVDIYDMDWRIGLDIESDDYIAGFPPRLDYTYEVAMSLHQGSSYAGANRGEGSVGGGGSISLGFYLIRSTATFEDKREIVEQSMVARL